MKKKMLILTVGLMMAAGLLFTSCEKEYLQQEAHTLVECDIPEGITPLKFGSEAEAVQFIKSLKQRPRMKVYVNEDSERIKLLNTQSIIQRSEYLTRSEYGGGETLDPDGWWFQSLSVNLFFDSIGGPVTITSYMVGFVFGVGWTQTSYSYYWTYSNGSPTIEYTVRGNEEYYLFFESIGHYYSNPIEISGSYAVQ